LSDSITIRTASVDDIPVLRELIHESVHGLQGSDYSPVQIEGALGTIYGTDSSMIRDGTFFIAECGNRVVGCGGWSRRNTAFGSDNSPVKDDSFLDPATRPAKIRGFFVHPEYARRGIASRILGLCETAAAEAGFKSFELVSTLTGAPLYGRHGYAEIGRVTLTLPNGQPYPAVRMTKSRASVQSAGLSV
jgi:GNAT superfamily N-acetyltransferase